MGYKMPPQIELRHLQQKLGPRISILDPTDE